MDDSGNTIAWVAKDGKVWARHLFYPGTSERVDVSSAEVPAVATSNTAQISADGKHVVFTTWAGNLVAGWQMARALLAAEKLEAQGDDVPFMRAKIATARFYAQHIMAKAPGLRDSIVNGADSVTAMALDAF